MEGWSRQEREGVMREEGGEEEEETGQEVQCVPSWVARGLILQ